MLEAGRPNLIDLLTAKGGFFMSKFTTALTGTVLWFFVPLTSLAQQADAPVYKDGDWWRVEVDVARPAGVSVAGSQFGGFPEYRVRIDSGKELVFGLRGDTSTEIESPLVVSLVLGKPGWLGELLRFPLCVGVSWRHRFQFQPPGMQLTWQEGRYEVVAWDKLGRKLASSARSRSS